MIWDKLYLENKIHRTCCSGDDGIKDNFWHGPTHLSCLISCHIPDSFLPFTTLDFSQALRVLFIPLSFQPQGLCTCCFLCLDCSSLPSHLVHSYHPSDLSRFLREAIPGLSEHWTGWSLLTSQAPHLCVRVCARVCDFPSLYSLSSLQTETVFLLLGTVSPTSCTEQVPSKHLMSEWIPKFLFLFIYG